MGTISLAVTLAASLATIFLAVKKPQFSLRIKERTFTFQSYYIAALFAPLILLLFGIISPREIYSGITADSGINPIKILILFFSMCYISLCLDNAGFFEYCAAAALSKAKKGQKTLFLYLYLFISLLTVFTSNDIIILSFTPFICYFCKGAKISPVPYIAALFAAANTLSLMMVIGNPTNIYIASYLNIGFFTYLKIMALPAVISGAAAYLCLRLMFSKQLKEKRKVRSALKYHLGIKPRRPLRCRRCRSLLYLCQ